MRPILPFSPRIFLIRDQNVAGNPTPGGKIPSWDLSLNFVPISYPAEIPAMLRMRPGDKELWRVANASGDSLVDLQLLFDGVPQTLQIVGLDGVPVDSQDGEARNGGSGKHLDSTHILLPTAARAEFVVSAPAPDGDNDTRRTLASIQTDKPSEPTENDSVVPTQSEPDWKTRFQGLAIAPVTNHRHLHFSENNPKSLFYSSVDGAKNALYNPANPPAIVTTQGSVEDWTIENRTLENHKSPSEVVPNSAASISE